MKTTSVRAAAVAAAAAGLALALAAAPARAVGRDPAECVAAWLAKLDAGPTAEDLASCGGDVAGELMRRAEGDAPNGLVRGRAILWLPAFAPDDAVVVLGAIVGDADEHAYFRAKAMGAAIALADSHPADVLAMVEVALGAAKDPYVRERAIDAALRLPGRTALAVLKAHRARERARWLMPKLKSAVETLEARPAP